MLIEEMVKNICCWEEKIQIPNPTGTHVLELSASTKPMSSVEAQHSLLFCYGS